MGGACFKPNKRSVGGPQSPQSPLLGRLIAPRSPSPKPALAGSTEQTYDAPPELTAALKSVVLLAGKQATDEKLDEALVILSAVDLEPATLWFRDWLTKASQKSQTALLALMQRLIGRAMEPGVAIAEELVAGESKGDVASVGHIVALCQDSLTINSMHRAGVSVAMSVLSDTFTRDQWRCRSDSELAASIVPSLDRFVLLLRPSLMARIQNSADNLCHWNEFLSCAGLPPLERHLSLLSYGAKAVVLGLMLIPDGVPPLVVVANRDTALLDASRQLPDEHARVLLPYFESVSGSKVIQGKRVEGGEGHGPRKEFFIAATGDASKKWCPVALPAPSESPTSEMQLSFVENRILLERADGQSPAESSSSARAAQIVSRALARGCIGDRIRLEFSNGAEVERIITATHGETCISTSDGSLCSGPDIVASAVCFCALSRPVKPLFEFHRGTNQQWFSAYASELDNPSYGQDLRRRFLTFGKLLLLSLANRCKIAFVLPAIFFRLLLHSDVKLTLDDLKDFDKDLHQSLKKCQKMSQKDFDSLKEVEGLSELMSREEYVLEKVKETFDPLAMQEIRNGFWSLSLPGLSFAGVFETDLRQLLCPVDDCSDTICIRDIFKVEIEDEMAQYEVFVNAFWSVVDGLSLADRKLFLRFLTGLESLPEPGTERLVIELPFSAFTKQEQIAMLDLLPQAHTCSNTLELPNYYEALKESGRIKGDEASKTFASALVEILRNKLLLAIRETSGYELDATGDEAGAMATPTSLDPGAQRVASTAPVALPPFDAAPSGMSTPFGTEPLRAPSAAIAITSVPFAAESPRAPTEKLGLPRDAWDDAPPAEAKLLSPRVARNSPAPSTPAKISSDVDTFLAELEFGLEAASRPEVFSSANSNSRPNSSFDASGLDVMKTTLT